MEIKSAFYPPPKILLPNMTIPPLQNFRVVLICQLLKISDNLINLKKIAQF